MQTGHQRQSCRQQQRRKAQGGRAHSVLHRRKRQIPCCSRQTRRCRSSNDTCGSCQVAPTKASGSGQRHLQGLRGRHPTSEPEIVRLSDNFAEPLTDLWQAGDQLCSCPASPSARCWSTSYPTSSYPISSYPISRPRTSYSAERASACFRTCGNYHLLKSGTASCVRYARHTSPPAETYGEKLFAALADQQTPKTKRAAG